MAFPLFINAQDCKLKKDIDEFTQKPKISTAFYPLNNSMLSIEATKNETDYFFVIKNQNANCFDEESTALFVFEGGKMKANYRHGGSNNCQGAFHIMIKTGNFTSQAIKKFCEKKVISITFTSKNEKTTVVELTPEQQQKLIDFSNCIANEVKVM
jgi:hypothetical protein